MSLAICAELLITVPSASASSEAILAAKLLETEVNEPLIPVAVRLLISEAFAPNEPLMSLAICAELDSAPSNTPENDPLKIEAVIAVNAPPPAMLFNVENVKTCL